MPQLLPAFETERLDGPKVERTVHAVSKGGGFVTKVVKSDLGYMVYFPKGHSIHVRSEKELRRLGFHVSPGLIDLVTGESLAPKNTSLREIVSKKTRNLRGSRATTGEDDVVDNGFAEDS